MNVADLPVPADQLTDEEVMQGVALDAESPGSSGVATYLLEQRFTAAEVRGYHRLMKWISLNKPKAWPEIVTAAQAALPERDESGVKGLFSALAKDAPGMPLLRIVPK